jgi:hypothetical protein
MARKKIAIRSDPEPKMTKAEQYALFKKTARTLGGDESEEAFERAFRKIVPPKTRHR